jgi:hypothetical protein
MNSIDGADCAHGVCVFDPRGCEECGTAPLIAEASHRENFCSLGHDCLCDRVIGGANPSCKHHRRVPHVRRHHPEKVRAA